MKAMFRFMAVVLIGTVLFTVSGCKSSSGENTALPDTEVSQNPVSNLEIVPEQDPAEETPSEKLEASAYYTYSETTPEIVFPKGEFAFKGKVLGSDGGIMTNPEKKNTDANGEVYPNSMITTYTVEILERYKGEYEGQTMEVKVVDGYGMDPDLILYGENETHVWSNRDIELLSLKEGDEALFLVNYKTLEPENITGYFIYGKDYGCMVKKADGRYKGIHASFEWTPELMRSLAEK